MTYLFDIMFSYVTIHSNKTRIKTKVVEDEFTPLGCRHDTFQ